MTIVKAPDLLGGGGQFLPFQGLGKRSLTWSVENREMF